jgi:NAD(P)-dependent dehydrogenase (short-subunit alcohol dehydrogenase family)
VDVFRPKNATRIRIVYEKWIVVKGRWARLVGGKPTGADLNDDDFRDFIDRAGAKKPLGRVGVPDDVARVVLFCSSHLAGFMSGSTLLVDGGDLAG